MFGNGSAKQYSDDKASPISLAFTGSSFSPADTSMGRTASNVTLLRKTRYSYASRSCFRASEIIEAMRLDDAPQRWPVDQAAQLTAPVQAGASTTMPNAMRYQAKGVKSWVAM